VGLTCGTNGGKMNVYSVRFEFFTAVTMKNGVFWVLTRATRRNNPEDTILNVYRFLARRPE
jgi:hypothetical protein